MRHLASILLFAYTLVMNGPVWTIFVMKTGFDNNNKILFTLLHNI